MEVVLGRPTSLNHVWNKPTAATHGRLFPWACANCDPPIQIDSINPDTRQMSYQSRSRSKPSDRSRRPDRPRNRAEAGWQEMKELQSTPGERCSCRGAAGLLKGRGPAPLVVERMATRTSGSPSRPSVRSAALSIFVSNAGDDRRRLLRGPDGDPLQAWQATFDTQATEILVAVRAAVPMMGKNDRIIASTYAPGGQTGSWQPWVAIGSAKAAKEALARYFAVALAQKGITVNIISPGACDDSVLQRTAPARVPDDQRLARERLDSHEAPGLPADVGNAVVLLCTDQASFITGHLLYVDGGASAMEPVFQLAIQGIK